MNVSGVLVSVVISALAVVSNPGFAQSLKEEYREKTISLSEVPRAAIHAAQKALDRTYRSQTHSGHKPTGI